MKVSRIKINGIVNPIGYSFDKICCSWLVSETEAKKTIHVKIDVAKEETFGNILYSKEGAALNAACEQLDLILEARTRYYVRIAVTGDNKEQAEGEAYFETAKMNEAWQGEWIKPQETDTFHPLFEKQFALKGQLTDARLYISGLGLYTVSLNGRKVSDEILTPYYSDYRTEVQYQTYDITEYIEAENRIEVALGNGWYKGHFGLAGMDKNFGDSFQMIAEIYLRYADGTEEVICTPAGETVLDFGQNFAGYVTFRSELPKGTKVVLDFGEILQKGNFYNANYRRAKSQLILHLF